jgi:ABC-type histidine transport system ATPase subunit
LVTSVYKTKKTNQYHENQFTSKIVTLITFIFLLFKMAIVTHEMGFARKVANRIMFLDQGILAEDSIPSEFFQNPKCDRYTSNR